MSAPAPVVPQIKTLYCPNCGGSITLRTVVHSVNAVCSFCNTILDAQSPTLRIIQLFQSKIKYTPLIPLGSRGRWENKSFEVIGYQVRGIEVEGVLYTWEEYLLFNPYYGYRYLTHYQGHWNFVRTINEMPQHAMAGTKPGVRYGNHTFAHFQTATARTEFVLGEFPWQVRYGETVQSRDYIKPPLMLSAEETADEVVWSKGVYTPGSEVWQAFQFKGSPPPPVGIFANQPSKLKAPGDYWGTYFMLLLLMVVPLAFIGLSSPRGTAFEQTYTFDPNNHGEHSFVTPIFDIKGRTSGVDVDIETNLSNNWIAFDFALINEDTGDAFNFGKEVSYYWGSDSDGPWREGSQTATARVASVPPGRYFLRVEPEEDQDNPFPYRPPVTYRLKVERGGARYGWFLVVVFLLLIPPIVQSIRWFSFENRRWAESDYGALVSSSSSDEDDD